jgi:hypothetical protein
MKGRGFNSHSVHIFFGGFFCVPILFALSIRRGGFEREGFFVGFLCQGLWFRDLAENL